MWLTKAGTSALVVLALLPSGADLWKQSQPIVTDVEVTSRYLDNTTYRVSLSGKIREGCAIESGSELMVAPPKGGNDLGQWEFKLDSGARVVSLDVGLVCKTDRRNQTLGPWPVLARETK